MYIFSPPIFSLLGSIVADRFDTYPLDYNHYLQGAFLNGSIHGYSGFDLSVSPPSWTSRPHQNAN